ncbi:hypothetical protein KJ966_11995 [bacterium]|nr:hypothetical protein [bacterium]
MDNNYQQILRIASDALSLKYSLNFSALYWQNDQNTLETKATISIKEGASGGDQFSLSPSMMGAILKPLIIVKPKDGIRQLQILIPLVREKQKVGILAFWGRAEADYVVDDDKRFLDMIGLMVAKIILALQSEKLRSGSNNELEAGPAADIREQIPADKTEIDSAFVRDSNRESSDFISVEFSEGIDEVKGIDDGSAVKEVDAKPEQIENIYKELPDLFLRVSGLNFLAFNRDCVIQHDHVLTNSKVFGGSLKEKSALDILFKWGIPTNKDSASFEKDPDFDMIRDLMQTVFARITDIDVLKEMLPAEIAVKDVTYGLDYHYFKSSDSVEDDKILIVFEDVTHEKTLEFKYNNEIDRANMIVKVALDIDGYYQYRRSTEKTFELITAELEKPLSELNLKSVLHHIQAIQGGAEIYEINEITQLTESILSILENLLRSDYSATQEDVDSVNRHVGLLQDRFQLLQTQYLDNLVSDEQILDKTVYRITKSKIYQIRDEISENIINKRMSELELVFEKNFKPFTHLKSLEEITQKRLERIKLYLWNHIAKPSVKDIARLMAGLRRQPIGLMFKRYAIIAVNLGERQKKRVEVEIKGAEIEVPFHTLEHLFTGLTFAIRNCVEHGLETMEERIDLDKSLEGNISIEASEEENRLKIVISDDGRGIDVKKIKAAAIRNRIMTEKEAAESSDEDILRIMFTKGFSTKKDSSGIFGRGVGLSAVGSAIEDLNGTVSIQTELKKGTTLQVEVPLQQEY